MFALAVCVWSLSALFSCALFARVGPEYWLFEFYGYLYYIKVQRETPSFWSAIFESISHTSISTTAAAAATAQSGIAKSRSALIGGRTETAVFSEFSHTDTTRTHTQHINTRIRQTHTRHQPRDMMQCVRYAHIASYLAAAGFGWLESR